ncbi:MAG: hypothetical protein WKG07_45990 [Hymenobacter sp.]
MVAVGERDGISGPAIAACAEGGRGRRWSSWPPSASSEPPPGPWTCRARSRSSGPVRPTTRPTWWCCSVLPTRRAPSIAAETVGRR